MIDVLGFIIIMLFIMFVTLLLVLGAVGLGIMVHELYKMIWGKY